jgi:4-hydroxybenzoate polyprenyltransferase
LAPVRAWQDEAMAQRQRDARHRLEAARTVIRQRPLLWTSVLLTSVGAAVVIWFAMNGLDLTVRVPIILVAAALNVLIAAGYAADFREHDHEG